MDVSSDCVVLCMWRKVEHCLTRTSSFLSSFGCMLSVDLGLSYGWTEVVELHSVGARCVSQ